MQLGAREAGHGSAGSGHSENVSLTPQVGGGLIGEAVFLGSAERGHAIGAEACRKTGTISGRSDVGLEACGCAGLIRGSPLRAAVCFSTTSLCLAVRENGSPR
jgi:hypothetical protein